MTAPEIEIHDPRVILRVKRIDDAVTSSQERNTRTIDMNDRRRSQRCKICRRNRRMTKSVRAAKGGGPRVDSA